MAEYRLTLPSMGEGVMEATITHWLKEIGDTVTEDECVLEISTDKVDSDLPSPVSGWLVKKLFTVNEIVKVGDVIGIIETNQVLDSTNFVKNNIDKIDTIPEAIPESEKPLTIKNLTQNRKESSEINPFLSPLVKSILVTEGISDDEVIKIKGTGKGNRITKDDVLLYLQDKMIESVAVSEFSIEETNNNEISVTTLTEATIDPKAELMETSTLPINTGNEEIVEMDRMRKLIAKNMITSKDTSVHVTSFIETDVTGLVNWRNKNKNLFKNREGEALTYMPVFVQAIIAAIKDYPMINISVEGERVIKKKNINIGIATALDNGNLIVPVVKNADQLSLSGLAKRINDLVDRARKNQLKPEDIQGGTYTISNIGGFGNIMGTPIINQPQVAILAVGVIQKKPAVIETPAGDFIGIRQKMFMSHAYDHRVIDGFLGGSFLKRVSDYLSNFDENTEI